MNAPAASRMALLREKNFRWMMGGAAVSSLGDQFTMIALPWLVLALTGDPLTLGLVIAAMSVPRALFILVGGALVDRYSPKSVLMLSKFANGTLLAILAAMVLTGQVAMPAVYALAIALGLSSAFSIPSGTSMLPHVVAPAHLPLANAMLMGTLKMTMLAGPLLAALVFALYGDGTGHGPDAARGIGLAIAFDCFSFFFSAWTLHHVQLLHGGPMAAPQAVLRAIGEALAAVWNDVALRVCIVYWALGSFVVGGTMQVALPVLASTRLDGAASLGLIMGVHGAGALAGMALTGSFGKLRLGTFGATLLALDALIGVLLVGLGWVSAAWQAASLMLLIGVLSGFMQVAIFTWIQQRVPRAMLGRAMSIFMFIFMGLAPMAAAITGALLAHVTLTALFAGAGAFLLAAACMAWLFTPMARVTDAPAIG